MLSAIQRIARAVQVPVTADVENGYGDPVNTARQVWEAGAVGINLEDVMGDGEPVLVNPEQQAETIRRIREAVPGLFINARTDIFLLAIGDMATQKAQAIERLRAYRAAGAHGLFAPGVKDASLIGELVSALDGSPLNILAGPGCPSLAEMKKLGAKRISVGSGPMRACLGLVTRIAQELQNSGTYQTMTEGQYPYSEANRLLDRRM
jgi:2-methylisocitrate lyase-like PEP mutase family enzyme